MTKFLIAAALTTSTVAAVALPAAADDWELQTSKHDTTKVITTASTTAEIRGAFVRVIRDHRALVRQVRAERRQARREARQAEREAARAARAAAAASDSQVTTTTAAPTYTSSSDGWADELAAVGFPSEAIPTMLGYIDRESGGDPSAINSSSGACGLLQLYPCYGGSAWLDPMTNLRLAYQKYQASGFSPWGG